MPTPRESLHRSLARRLGNRELACGRGDNHSQSVQNHGDPTGAAYAFMMRPTTAPSAITS
jgi:hypothetical protein